MNKHPVRPHKAPLGDMRVGASLDKVATDVLRPLPRTTRENKYILAVTGYFTKWVEILAVPDQISITSAEKILNEFIVRFGCPLSLHCDQCRNFESQNFKELCQLLEIKKYKNYL